MFLKKQNKEMAARVLKHVIIFKVKYKFIIIFFLAFGTT